MNASIPAVIKIHINSQLQDERAACEFAQLRHNVKRLLASLKWYVQVIIGTAHLYNLLIDELRVVLADYDEIP